MARTLSYREHAWNLVEATEHRPGDVEVVHECHYCHDRKHGMDARLPRLGCPVGPTPAEEGGKPSLSTD